MSNRPEDRDRQALASDGMRNATRASIFLSGKLYLAHADQPIDVRVRNLSATGMMVESPRMAQLGDEVHIELRNIGKIAARVAWIAEKRMGLAVYEPLDPSAARQSVGSQSAAPRYTETYVASGARPALRRF